MASSTVVDAKALAEGRFADDEEAVQAQRAADPNLEHENPIEELFEDQLNCADMVILNKTDLLDGAEQDQVTGDLKGMVRAGTRLVPTRHGVIDIAALLGVGASAEDDMHNRLSHHEMEGEGAARPRRLRHLHRQPGRSRRPRGTPQAHRNNNRNA